MRKYFFKLFIYFLKIVIAASYDRTKRNIIFAEFVNAIKIWKRRIVERESCLCIYGGREDFLHAF